MRGALEAPFGELVRSDYLPGASTVSDHPELGDDSAVSSSGSGVL